MQKENGMDKRGKNQNGLQLGFIRLWFATSKDFFLSRRIEMYFLKSNFSVVSQLKCSKLVWNNCFIDKKVWYKYIFLFFIRVTTVGKKRNYLLYSDFYVHIYNFLIQTSGLMPFRRIFLFLLLCGIYRFTRKSNLHFFSSVHFPYIVTTTLFVTLDYHISVVKLIYQKKLTNTLPGYQVSNMQFITSNSASSFN